MCIKGLSRFANKIIFVFFLFYHLRILPTSSADNYPYYINYVTNEASEISSDSTPPNSLTLHVYKSHARVVYKEVY